MLPRMESKEAIMRKAKGDPPRPTQAELAILRVLWDRGPSSVREVHEAMNPGRDTGYTTVLKTLQIMIGKGLVTRCLLYTSDAADERSSVDLGGRRIIK